MQGGSVLKDKPYNTTYIYQVTDCRNKYGRVMLADLNIIPLLISSLTSRAAKLNVRYTKYGLRSVVQSAFLQCCYSKHVFHVM